MKILFLLIMTACLDKPVGSLNIEEEEVKPVIESTTTTLKESDDSDEDHGEPGEDAPPSESAPIVFEVSNPNIELNLNEEVMIPFSLKALETFPGGSVNISLENSFDDIEVSLDKASIELSANESKEVTLRIKTKDMSPSFKNEKVKLLASISSNSNNETRFEFNLTVEATLIIGVLSDAVPHDYNVKDKICLREHSGEGVRIIYKNMTMDFGQDGRGPCMHTDPPLRHCTTSTGRLKPGEEYIQERVKASSGKVDSTFYNHFESGDTVGRKIYFNLDAGDEKGLCTE